MADYHRTSMLELDDVHRLLPREILEDIGIIGPAEQQLLVGVENLAARLAGVLGGATKMTSCHHPQVNIARRLGSRDAIAGGGNLQRVAATPLLPAPAVPWQAMEALRNGLVLHPTAALPRFAPAWPLAGRAQPTTVCRSGGTGVFLPRTEVVRRTAKAARSPSNDVKPMRQSRAQKHRRGEQAAMAMIRKQQEMQAMAAQMLQRYLDVHARPELALPHEWTY